MLERSPTNPRRGKGPGDSVPETLRKWVRQVEVDQGLMAGSTTEERAEIRQLPREVVDQQRAPSLKAATLYFARKADPRQR